MGGGCCSSGCVDCGSVFSVTTKIRILDFVVGLSELAEKMRPVAHFFVPLGEPVSLLEKLAVSSCSNEYDAVGFTLIDQQKIATGVTFPVIFPWSG